DQRQRSDRGVLDRDDGLHHRGRGRSRAAQPHGAGQPWRAVMAQNVNPTFVKTPNRGLVQISTGSGTNLVTAYTGGANGSKINGVTIWQTSSSTLLVNVFIVNAAVNYTLNQASVPTNTVTQALPTTLPVDSDGNTYLILASSADTLQMSVTSTIPTATALASIITVAGDF